MYPHKQEDKLRKVFEFFTRKRIGRAKKQLQKGQIPLFTYTAEEQQEIIEELAKVAIEVNLGIFESWRTLSKQDLTKTDLKGAKLWIKKNFEQINSTKDFEMLAKLRESRITETVGKYNRDLTVFENGKASKSAIRVLKQDVRNNRASKEIQGIVDSLEQGTYSLKDIKALERWQTNRNELLARNETGNIYAQETKDLMIENNMEYFVWRTMLDSRVRIEHAEREGEVFSIKEIDVLPGQEFNCRCSAEFIK